MFCSFYSVLLVLFMQNGHINGLTGWPDGRYGLLKPKTGCPEEWTYNDWKTSDWEDVYKGWTDRGYIFQVTERIYPNNTSSENLNIDGYVDSRFVLRSFCVKRRDVEQPFIKWPQGRYCIYQETVPSGFIEFQYGTDYEKSSKYVDDFSVNWSWKTRIRFTCQSNGNKTTPISLPITKPFYLLPYGSRDCQQVEWMVATSEWIKYHTRNYEDYRHDQMYRTVPYHELGDFNHTGITMYYCYYKSCNYTLNETGGVFQSPGFPGKYPDGQLCSWRIMVPENHTLHVHFTHFSLNGKQTSSGYDKLQFYKIVNGSFALNDTLNGKRNRNLTSNTDVKFVFSSNERHSSTGFRAHYRVFMPTKITTTPLATTTKLPTTSKPTTTTKPPTTKAPTSKPLQTNKPTITNKPRKPKTQGTTKANKPTRKTTNTTQRSTSNNGASNSFKGSRLFSCDMTCNIVVMVIPLVCSLLVIFLVIDIVYRCRTKNKRKNKTDNSRNDDCLAVNMTYERGDVILDHTPDTTVGVSMVNTIDDQPQSRDEPPDYEDLDYTQVSDIPPPRRSSKRQECHALKPIGTDTSSVFYHVLEPPKTESKGPQCHAAQPVANGAPEVFYHTLEPPTDLTRPSYENLSEVNHYTLNPAYEPAENSTAPFVEVNKLYDYPSV